jgi:hypothetical protein
VLENGANYILNNLSVYREDENSLSEAAWTLALTNRISESREIWKSLNTQKLSRHGYLAYAYTAHILDQYTPQISVSLDNRMFSSGSDTDYWYWDTAADQ